MKKRLKFFQELFLGHFFIENANLSIVINAKSTYNKEQRSNI
jgi:hypothetical protein